ncbi:hypothetical protein SDD30_01180 [Moorella naiadis]|uniref:hypothetical protein n=1 Tax=Moorella naiadis (nom. illeg.) TaxID=3093670 RepID=UPI003D9C9083
MAYLFLILGALLILVFIRPALHQLRLDMEIQADASLPAVPPAEPDREGVRELEERLAELQETVAALTARLAGADEEPAPFPALPEAASRQESGVDAGPVGKTFRAYLNAALVSNPERQAPGVKVAASAGEPPGDKVGKDEPSAAQELPGIMAAIRQAHARGESIESLARRFGRGKGEIALILNLHR